MKLYRDVLDDKIIISENQYLLATSRLNLDAGNKGVNFLFLLSGASHPASLRSRDSKGSRGRRPRKTKNRSIASIIEEIFCQSNAVRGHTDFQQCKLASNSITVCELSGFG